MTPYKHTFYYIPVEISKGMFSTEYSVSLKLANGNTVSFFADKELFKHENEKWYLKVNLVEQHDNKSVVLLPSETFETASPYAEVLMT